MVGTKDTFSVVDGGKCESRHNDPPSGPLVASLRTRDYNVQTLPRLLIDLLWRQSALVLPWFKFLRLRILHYFGN